MLRAFQYFRLPCRLSQAVLAGDAWSYIACLLGTGPIVHFKGGRQSDTSCLYETLKHSPTRTAAVQTEKTCLTLIFCAPLATLSFSNPDAPNLPRVTLLFSPKTRRQTTHTHTHTQHARTSRAERERGKRKNKPTQDSKTKASEARCIHPSTVQYAI